EEHQRFAGAKARTMTLHEEINAFTESSTSMVLISKKRVCSKSGLLPFSNVTQINKL
ncbi:hypothetical protein MKW92_008722, partial [Papaver armeniacum]